MLAEVVKCEFLDGLYSLRCLDEGELAWDESLCCG